MSSFLRVRLYPSPASDALGFACRPRPAAPRIARCTPRSIPQLQRPRGSQSGCYLRFRPSGGERMPGAGPAARRSAELLRRRSLRWAKCLLEGCYRVDGVAHAMYIRSSPTAIEKLDCPSMKRRQPCAGYVPGNKCPPSALSAEQHSIGHYKQ